MSPMQRGRPLILGHRGYKALYPENTLLAFRKALETGADGVECDLQKTADGRYVITHDPPAGQGAGLPELGSLLAELPRGAYLDLELKGETLSRRDCGPIRAILEAGAEPERLMISSFAPRLLGVFRRRGFTVGLLVHEKLARLGAVPLFIQVLLARPRFVNLPVGMMRDLGSCRRRLVLRLLRAAGLSVLFWTVNSEAEARAVHEWADIIVTDDVGLLRRLLPVSRAEGGGRLPRRPQPP